MRVLLIFGGGSFLSSYFFRFPCSTTGKVKQSFLYTGFRTIAQGFFGGKSISQAQAALYLSYSTFFNIFWCANVAVKNQISLFPLVSKAIPVLVCA